MDNVNALTGQNLYAALIVLVALCGLFILFVNTVEAARKLRTPKARKEENLTVHQRDCDRKFSNDRKALDDHEKRIERLEDASCVQCTALHALLEHELHNGNAKEMQDASKALFNHLNNRTKGA